MDYTALNYSYLIYLILILLFLFGSFLLSNKKNINRTIQSLSIWGLIFFALLVSYYIWHDLKISIDKEKYNYNIDTNKIIIIEKAPDNHFYLPLLINDKKIKFLVDTGATRTLLSKKDFMLVKDEITILSSNKVINTANGSIIANEIIYNDVKLFDYNLGKIAFLVAKDAYVGPNISLLGLDLLNQIYNYQISNDYLKLQLNPD